MMLEGAILDLPPIESLEQAEAEFAELVKPARETRFGRVSWGDLRTRGYRAPDFVIDDWLVKSEQSFIAGEPQSGKSFLAMHAALSIATGMEFFGRKVKPGLVIYQAGESGTGVLDQRIPAWIKHFGADVPDSVPFEILPAKVDLWRPDGNAEAFIEAIKNIAAEWEGAPLQAVFIDTLSKAMAGANENDGRDISRVLGNVERISRETGAHVCVIHHLPKNGSGMRGHGSLKGDVDSVAFVRCDPETKIRTWKIDKMKDGEAGAEIKFELMRVELGARDDGKPVSSCVCLPVGQKEAARAADAAKGFKLSPTEEPIFRALMLARKEKGVMAGPEEIGAGIPSDQLIVNFHEWREAYRSVAPPDEDGNPPSLDAARKQFARKHSALIKYDVIGWKSPWMWWTGKRIRGFPETIPEDERRTKRGQDQAGAVAGSGGNSDESGLGSDDYSF